MLVPRNAPGVKPARFKTRLNCRRADFRIQHSGIHARGAHPDCFQGEWLTSTTGERDPGRLAPERCSRGLAALPLITRTFIARMDVAGFRGQAQVMLGTRPFGGMSQSAADVDLPLRLSVHCGNADLTMERLVSPTMECERLKRVMATVVVAAVGSLSLMVTAQTAAATQTYNFTDCGPALNGQTISSPSGDDVRLTFTTCGTGNPLYVDSSSPVGTNTSVVISGATVAVGDDGTNHYIDIYTASPLGPPADGTYLVYYNIGAYNGSFTVVIGGASPSPTPSTDTSSSSGPAPVIQQFGKPATGTCDEVAPEDLNWAGVPSGGWTTAWGEWLHDGLGGWACSRTLSYSSAQAKWIVD